MKFVVIILFIIYNGSVFSCEQAGGIGVSKIVKYLKNGDQTLNININIDKTSCEISSVTYIVFGKHKDQFRLFYRDIPISGYRTNKDASEAKMLADRLISGFTLDNLANRKYGDDNSECFFSFLVDETIYQRIINENYPVYKFQSGYDSKEWITYIPEFGQSVVVAGFSC